MSRRLMLCAVLVLAGCTSESPPVKPPPVKPPPTIRIDVEVIGDITIIVNGVPVT